MHLNYYQPVASNIRRSVYSQPIQQSIEWRLNRKWRGDDDVVPFVNHRLMDVGTVYDEESFLVWLAGGAKGSRPADPRPSFLEDKP